MGIQRVPTLGDDYKIRDKHMPPYVHEGSAFADIAKAPGVDPTGATECAAAIQTALNACATAGLRAYAKGTFKIATSVTFNADVDFGDATFNYTGATGMAVQVGDSATPLRRKRHVRLPRIVNTSKATTGWTAVAGSWGVRILNCYSCEITIPHVTGFDVGVLMAGASNNGTAYTDIHLGHLDNNKVNWKFANDSTGWTNQNNIFGGRMSHNLAEGTVVAGTAHVLVADSTQIVNGNTFHGTSLESPNTVEWHLDCYGNDNMFIGCRWENTGAGPRVNWRGTSKGNVILGGFNADQIAETRATGSQNEIHTRVIRRFLGGDNTHATVVYENPNSTASAYLLGMTAGAWAAGDSEATQWVWKLSGTQLLGKQRGDTTPRVVIDFATGFVRVGSGVTSSRPLPVTAGAGGLFYDTTLSKLVVSDGTTWRDATGTAV